MRKVILYIASSLDGFIARSDGSVDWLFTDGDCGYASFYKSIDTVVMGRKTYEQALTFEDHPFKGKATYVFSRTKPGATDKHMRYVSGDVGEWVRGRRETPGKETWLVGGGELVQTFLAKNLVDEIMLFVHPILLGSGIPLFLPLPEVTPLRLVRCVPYDNGLVQLHYMKAS